MTATADSKEALQRWADAWRLAAQVNEADRRRSLRELTEASAWEDAENILSGLPAWRPDGSICGLIEQQALFRRLAGL